MKTSFTIGRLFLAVRTVILHTLVLFGCQFFTTTPTTAQNSICDTWRIQICNTPQLGETCVESDACHTLFYYVYLVQNGNEDSQDSLDFNFYYFWFTGEINTFWSDIDSIKTYTCSPDGINDLTSAAPPRFVLEKKAQKFSYFVDRRDWQNNPIKWRVPGRKLLFVLAVNAFPEEKVKPFSTFQSYSMSLDSAGVPLECVRKLSFCDSIPLFTKKVSLPPACTDAPFAFTIGTPVADSTLEFPNRMKIPVFVAVSDTLTAPVTISEVDFVIYTQSTPPMGLYTVPNLVNFPNVVAQVKNQSIIENNTAKYIHGIIPSMTVPSGLAQTPQNTLFYIYTNGPATVLDCGNASFFFSFERRAIFNGNCCLPSASPSPDSASPPPIRIDWPGEVPCTYCYVTVNANRSTAPATVGGCGDIAFDLNLSSNNPVNYVYDSGTFIIDIRHSEVLEWNAALTTAAPELTESSITVLPSPAPGVLRLRYHFEGLVTVPRGSLIPLSHLVFDGAAVCVTSITFYAATVHRPNQVYPCAVIGARTDFKPDVNADDMCRQNVLMHFVNYFDTSAVAKVSYVLSAQLPSTSPIPPYIYCIHSGMADDAGFSATCACPVADNVEQKITPTRNDNHMNGVSTYDLVLISKHIQGAEPFTNPYTMIAADANKSNSITTFDIVELRKLVLGIYTQLPANSSFRFVRRDFTFPNPLNPWQTVFPETYKFKARSTAANFYAIKIGDVSGNAVTSLLSAEERQMNVLPLGYANTGGKRGQILEIPLFVQQPTDLAAWQMALQYAPEVLKIKDIRWMTATMAASEQSYDWNIPVPGELRLSWMEGTGTAIALDAHAPLCYLQVELLQDQTATASLFNILPASESIASEMYAVNGVSTALSLQPVAVDEFPSIAQAAAINPKSDWMAAIYPNPAPGQFRIEVTLPEGGNSTITVFDVLGRNYFRQTFSLIVGLNTVPAAQLPALYTGLYWVQIDTPLGRQTLRLIVE